MSDVVLARENLRLAKEDLREALKLTVDIPAGTKAHASREKIFAAQNRISAAVDALQSGIKSE